MPQTKTGKEVVTGRKTSKFQWPRFRMPHKYVVYDKLHRSTVFVLISGVVICTIRMAIDAVHHFTVRKPIIYEIARIDKEAEMERMQAEREKSLNLQQKLQEEADKV
ncbi:uncharacterized protein LOC123561639 [Mercenaria mercenaria]|uniref:uncharacterized protein LOC123561639 n=1 Tax=Mercenaria mercenaria TaxID=6596 RepID=UPI001E1DE6FE|nr:uncharacterized protein LOC123561639 [Mercenaria mercenaria]